MQFNQVYLQDLEDLDLDLDLSLEKTHKIRLVENPKVDMICRYDRSRSRVQSIESLQLDLDVDLESSRPMSFECLESNYYLI